MKRIISSILFLVLFFSLSAQEVDSIIDIRDGQVYKVVKIGQQWWMQENLKATKYTNGPPIPLVEGTSEWDALGNTDKAYCFYNNSDSIANIYGALYTWAAAMNGATSSDANPSNVQGICPIGWHIPSDAEWKELEMYLGMSQAQADGTNPRGTDEGGKLKEVDTTHWASPNNGATNSSGFTALPGGVRGSGFVGMGYDAYFWSSAECNSNSAWYRRLNYDFSVVIRYGPSTDYGFKGYGFSVRCVKGTGIFPFTLSFETSQVSSLGGSDGLINISVSGGQPPYSYFWSCDSSSEDISSLIAGVYSVIVTDANDSTVTDSIRIYDTFLDERDGQRYKAITLGEQVWMAENLNFYTDTGSWYYNDDSISYASEYGRLYNWTTALDISPIYDITNYNADFQHKGICTDGWHIPSNEEWIELTDFLGGDSVAGGKLKEAGTAHWENPNTGSTNESGFTALPCGYRNYDGSFNLLNSVNFIWSSSEFNPTNASYLRLRSGYSDAILSWHYKGTGHSVRCLKDSYKLKDKTICHGETNAILISTVENTRWYVDNEMTKLIFSGDTLVLEDSEIGTYTYYALLTINDSTSITDSATLVISSLPSIQAISTVNEVGCNTNDGQIEITATDIYPLIYSIDGGKSFYDISGQFNGLSNGNYPVVVMNSNDCKTFGNTIELISEGVIPPAPTVSGEQYCFGDIVSEITAFPSQGGTITWYSDPELTNTLTTGNSFTPSDFTGTHTLYITETVNNCESPSKEVVIKLNQDQPIEPEEICLVTIDLSTGKNLIVWEQSPDPSISSYNIYCETDVINEFELIGSVNSNELSVFLDETANPEIRPYVYKITVVDICGNESDYSAYHEPMFLQFSGYASGVNLAWGDYEIEGSEISFITYEIYRGTKSGTLEKIDQVSARVDRYTDTDPSALTKKYYYRIAGILENPCYPTGGDKKADVDSILTAFSNIEDNQIIGIEENISNHVLSISPNPFNNSTIIQFSNIEGHPYSLYIMDLTGKVCRIVDNITASEYVLDKGDLKEGFYFVEFRGSKIYRGKIIIE